MFKSKKISIMNERKSAQPFQQPNSILPSLPQEIIIEILLRLPVKYLLQFRLVCKSWRSLISSSHFVKTHLKISSQNIDFAHHRLIFSSTQPYFDLKTCSLHSLLYEPSACAYDLNYPLKSPHRSVWIVGSCNGLVCLAIEEDILFLWNPTTKDCRRLPNLGIKLRYGCYVIYGFGYDEVNDDYKVVGIFCVFGNGGVYETEVGIYSLKTNSWRRTQDFAYGIPLDDAGKYLNGALHWSSSKRMGTNSWVIVSLNLSKETYQEVMQPKYENGDFDLTLGRLGECLCVLCNYRQSRADLWIMKECGATKSWNKLFSIPYLSDPGKFRYSTPLCISKNGEILMEFGPRMILYNPNDNTFRYPEIHNFGVLLEVDTYIESLVSPNAG